MSDEWIVQMTSAKGLLFRSFYMCKDCQFVWTALGQGTYEMEGCCPACGDTEIDYAPKRARESFLQRFQDDLQGLQADVASEEDQ